ncbi:hypothetical protein B0H19DRAFT_1257609 [Mycena capillaripes]|nr:hypothetical protein B0H19DRAFT_1257609 [Mycena capillaripes]
MHLVLDAHVPDQPRASRLSSESRASRVSDLYRTSLQLKKTTQLRASRRLLSRKDRALVSVFWRYAHVLTLYLTHLHTSRSSTIITPGIKTPKVPFGILRDTCQMLDIVKLHGSMGRLTFVHPLDRSHLLALSYTRPHSSSFLRLSNGESAFSFPGVLRQLRACGPLLDLGLYVNPSISWGIGIKQRRMWAHRSLAPLFAAH